MKKSFGENLNATGDQSAASATENPKVTVMPPDQSAPTKETMIQKITTHTAALVAGIALGFVIAKYFVKK